MKLKITILFVLSVLMISCSSEEDSKSKQFTFLDFEKDVLLPSPNSQSIIFYSFDFDENLGKWELKLTDSENNDVPVVLTSAAKTNFAYNEGKNYVQKVIISAALKIEGVYTLVIKNKTTNQIYTDRFLVNSDVFDQLKTETWESYNVSPDITPTTVYDYYYFHNLKNTIGSEIKTNGIVGIDLEDKKTLQKYSLDFSINTYTKKVEFIIPTGVPAGIYFVSVRYNTLTSAYFVKDIVVQKEKKPAILSINKNTFKGGETMVLKGSDFRYKMDLNLFSATEFRQFELLTSLVFQDKNGTGEIYLSTYKMDPTFTYMNAEATEINFPIPKNTGETDWFYSNLNEKIYFEGTVSVKTGSFVSEAIPIRIDYK